MISRFLWGIEFSSTGHEEDVVLKPCLEIGRANMNIVNETFVPYFYIYFPIIQKLGVLIPSSSFEAYFLIDINVSPS